jgi:hypothetical protein
MSGFLERMIGAARLDPAIYEEVEHDTAAGKQALAVVLLAGAAAALPELVRLSLGGLFVTMLAAVVAWGVWAFLTFVIGTRLLPEPQTSADPGQLLRTLGFAASPGVVQVVGIIPPLRPFALVAAELWVIAAMVVAVRQALDYTSTLRAIGVCAIGWVVQLLVSAALIAALLPRPDAARAQSRRNVAKPPSAGSVGVVRPDGSAPPVQ